MDTTANPDGMMLGYISNLYQVMLYIGLMPSFHRGKPMWKKVSGDYGPLFFTLASPSGAVIADIVVLYAKQTVKL